VLLNNETFTIESENYIDILFFNATTTLVSFFNGDYDWLSRSIIYVDLSHFNSSLVTNTGNMFYSCSSLKEINFNNFQTKYISNMRYMFKGCENFLSLNLSKFNTSMVENMDGMFLGCKNLKSLDISSFNVSKVRSTVCKI